MINCRGDKLRCQLDFIDYEFNNAHEYYQAIILFF
jgi:hypothetical protein